MFVSIVVSSLGRYGNFRDSGAAKLCVSRGHSAGFAWGQRIREREKESGGHGVLA